jgi:hypothetical protein
LRKEDKQAEADVEKSDPVQYENFEKQKDFIKNEGVEVFATELQLLSLFTFP